MAQRSVIHPKNPQKRLIRQAIAILRRGGVMVYTTDASYALGCRLSAKEALDRIRQIRQLPENHQFSIACRDLSQAAHFGRLRVEAFRIIRQLIPGPYTFILRAMRELPRRLQHPKRKTIGIRVPDHPVAQALLEELGEPIFTTALTLPGGEEALADPEEIQTQLNKQVDLILDSGVIPYEPTTIIDFTDEMLKVVRWGKGKEKVAEILEE